MRSLSYLLYNCLIKSTACTPCSMPHYHLCRLFQIRNVVHLFYSFVCLSSHNTIMLQNLTNFSMRIYFLTIHNILIFQSIRLQRIQIKWILVQNINKHMYIIPHILKLLRCSIIIVHYIAFYFRFLILYINVSLLKYVCCFQKSRYTYCRKTYLRPSSKIIF